VTTLTREPLGEISISTGALQQIVVHAARSVDGARVRRPRKAVEIRAADNRWRIALALGARRGAQLADLGAAVQERVADAVQTMCEAEVEAVDVTIEELTDGD
jgi:uncharacterized alkaline shock family protein YloU